MTANLSRTHAPELSILSIGLRRWVQLPFMVAIVKNRLQPLVVILLVVFDVATVAKDVHLPESHNAAFRALVECGHRAKYASRRIEWFATGVQTFGKFPEGEHPCDSTDGDVLGGERRFTLDGGVQTPSPESETFPGRSGELRFTLDGGG